VKKGELLFVIDKRTYQKAVDQAEARVLADDAAYKAAVSDAKIAEDLAAQRAGSEIDKITKIGRRDSPRRRSRPPRRRWPQRASIWNSARCAPRLTGESPRTWWTGEISSARPGSRRCWPGLSAPAHLRHARRQRERFHGRPARGASPDRPTPPPARSRPA